MDALCAAREIVERSVALRDVAVALGKKGEVLFQKGEFCQAHTKFLMASNSISSSPGSGMPILQLSLIYNIALCQPKSGVSSEALRACQQVLQLDPGFYRALHCRSLVFMEQGRFAEAVRRATELAPREKSMRSARIR